MFPAAFVFSVTPRDAGSEARVKRLMQKKARRRFATGCFKMQRSLFIIRRGARKWVSISRPPISVGARPRSSSKRLATEKGKNKGAIFFDRLLFEVRRMQLSVGGMEEEVGRGALLPLKKVGEVLPCYNLETKKNICIATKGKWFKPEYIIEWGEKNTINNATMTADA